jgi:anti-sigma factor RsiW
MVDRQDIDALLVGALYGELTPAEEARLAAHLESHPADRSALEDLKTARQAVRESKVFDFQHEPPQAISAMLLQEAHRRAPKPARVREEKEGWFARLARSFLAHPAMAAAAMLVLVVGVAGTLYLRKGNDESAFKQATLDSTGSVAPAGPALTATPPAAEPQQGLDQGAAGAGSSMAVDLAEDQKNAPERLQQQADKNAKADDYDRTRDMRKLEVSKTDPTAHRAPPSKPSINVPKPDLAPKDLDTPKAKAATKGFAGEAEDIGGLADNAGIPTGGAGGAARGGKESASVNATVAAPRNAAPATPAPTAQAPQPAPAPPPPPPAVAKAPVAGNAPAAKTAPPKSDVIARAQALLAKAISAAQDDKNCAVAADLAKQIHTLSPAFYDENVVDNRQLKGCLNAYIKPEADRAKKASPAPRANESAK